MVQKAVNRFHVYQQHGAGLLGPVAKLVERIAGKSSPCLAGMCWQGAIGYRRREGRVLGQVAAAPSDLPPAHCPSSQLLFFYSSFVLHVFRFSHPALPQPSLDSLKPEAATLLFLLPLCSLPSFPFPQEVPAMPSDAQRCPLQPTMPLASYFSPALCHHSVFIPTMVGCVSPFISSHFWISPPPTLLPPSLCVSVGKFY